MSSPRLTLPPSLIALVLFTGLIIAASALPVRQIKPLPNPIILAHNEHVRYCVDDYFAGFNLTFDHFVSTDKVKALENTTFNTKADLTSAKSFKSADGKLIMAYLHGDLKVTVVPFENGRLSKSFQVPIANAKVCYDLEFLDQDFIVVDCNMEDSQKAFAFISLKTNKVVKVTDNDEKFKVHRNRQLRAANGFNGNHLISLIASEDVKNKTAWQINFIKFDKNRDIDSVAKFALNDFEDLGSDFLLNDILAVSSSELLLAGDQSLYLAKPQGDTFESLKSYPLNDNPNSFSSLQSSGPLLSTLLTSDSTAYEILQSQEGGYLEVGDIFVDTIYHDSYAAIEHAQLTKDFAILITGGAKPSIYIFKRGDAKTSDIFYFNYISPQALPFDEPVKLITHYEKNVMFWVTSTGVQPFSIQEIWLDIINTKPTEPLILPLRVCSESDCISQDIELIGLDQEDYHIYQLNKNELKFVKTYNEPLDIKPDDLFAAPHLNYNLTSDEGNLRVPDYLPLALSVGGLPTSFMSIDYDPKTDNFRLHHQPEGVDSLDLYLCKLASMETDNRFLNCDKKLSSDNPGKVQKIYSADPDFDTIETIDSNGQRVALLSSKKLGKTFIEIPQTSNGCDAIYRSYDNHIENNLFCANGNNITVVTNSSWVNIDHILLEDSFTPKQILTHPAFPGLLFVSNSTSISIINSEFYLGAHYDVDTATINRIPVPNDPDFRFVVTSSHIVIFLPKNDSISEFEITNPLDIIFNKQYMLHGSKLLLSEKTLAYSQATDLIYLAITVPFNTDLAFLVVLEPNGLGSSNFKYVFNSTSTMNLSKYTLSVTSLDSGTDLVLYGTSGGIQALIVGKEAKITLTSNYVGNNDLFAEKSFTIIAKSPYTEEESTKNAKIYFINTQRSIAPLAGDINLKMDLTFRNDTKIIFKERDFFNGPAFRWSINKEVEGDNIKLVPRVHSTDVLGSSVLPTSIMDISYPSRRVARGLILILEQGTQKIHVYQSSNFPAPESKLPSPVVHDLDSLIVDTNECYQVEMDPNQVYMAALCYDEKKSAAYVDVMKINDTSLHYQLIVPTETPMALYKVVSDYLFYTTRDSYNAIYVYKISQDKANLKVDLLKIITRDDLTIGRRDNITDMDGFRLQDGQAGVFVVTGSTGFNYIFLKGDNIKISSYPNFLSLFSNDHLEGYNNAPVFQAISLLRRSRSDDSNIFTLVLASKNAFSYKLKVTTNPQGNIAAIDVLEGYIQYQNYFWVPTVSATADTVVLVGMTPPGPGTSPKLHYFFYDQKSVPTLNTSYPLYDAFQVITTDVILNIRQRPLLLLLKRREEQLIYLRNSLVVQGVTGGLKEYKIEDAFSLETPASRVSSTYVDLVAANDFWSNSIRIPIQNYGNVLTGVDPGKIILFVFGGLGLAFIIVVVLIKVFSNKDKKQLKDTFAAIPEDTSQQNVDTDASQYFKIQD